MTVARSITKGDRAHLFWTNCLGPSRLVGWHNGVILPRRPPSSLPLHYIYLRNGVISPVTSLSLVLVTKRIYGAGAPKTRRAYSLSLWQPHDDDGERDESTCLPFPTLLGGTRHQIRNTHTHYRTCCILKFPHIDFVVSFQKHENSKQSQVFIF